MAKQQKAQASANSQLFAEVQGLREEVLRLNGLVEEQQYHIERLKQQRLDDYVDLDKRIAALTAANPHVSVGSDTAVSNNAVVGNDKAAYQAAYDLLSERKFDLIYLICHKPSQVFRNFEKNIYRYKKNVFKVILII